MDYSGMLSSAKKRLKSASLRARSKKTSALASIRAKDKSKNKTYKTSSASDMKDLRSISSYVKALAYSGKDRSPESTRTPDSITPGQKEEFDKKTATTNKSINGVMKKHLFKSLKDDADKKSKKAGK